MSLKEEVDKISKEFGFASDEFYDELEEEKIEVIDLTSREDVIDFGYSFFPEETQKKDYYEKVSLEIYLPKGEELAFYKYEE